MFPRFRKNRETWGTRLAPFTEATTCALQGGSHTSCARMRRQIVAIPGIRAVPYAIRLLDRILARELRSHGCSRLVISRCCEVVPAFLMQRSICCKFRQCHL